MSFEKFILSELFSLLFDETIYEKYKYNYFCNHELNEGYIQKAATCNNIGHKIVCCTKCEYTTYEFIKRKKHNWVNNKYSEPTYICTECCVRADWKD